MSDERAASKSIPGGEAERPTQIPARGWTQVLKRAWAEVKTHNVALLSGGVAFFAFLALFPAIIAGISMVGLVADPATIAAQVRSLTNGLPPEASQLITNQLASVTRSSGGSLSLTLISSLAVALFSASSVARASLHLESGHLPAGTRARLVDAVLDAPEVSSCQHVQVAFPLGDTETLDRVCERCDTGEVRAVGATCLVEADVPNPGAGPSTDPDPGSTGERRS